MSLTQTAIDENLTAAVIGSFIISDASSGDTHTVTLDETSSSLFAIDGLNLVLASGVALDYEVAQSHVITVRVTDEDGLTFDQIFTINVNDLVEPLSGDDGDNVVNAQLGPNTVTLGGGADELRGQLPELLGDSVSDFSTEDRIVFLGSQIQRGNIAVTSGSAILTIDEDGDGTAEGSITLDGDFTGGDFLTVIDGLNTLLSFETFLPSLSEGAAVSSAEVNGINNQDFLTGDGANGFRVTLDAAQMAAAFDNSLGVYEVDSAGNIVNVRLLAASVKASGGTSLEITDVAGGNALGFFIVKDGADWAEGLGPDDILSFLDGDTGATTSTLGRDLRLAVNGEATEVETFHSFSPSLNPGAVQHVLSGVDPGGRSITVGFEDQTGGGDRDYQDVVFSVALSTPLQPVSPTPQTVAQDLRATTGEDSALIVAPELSGPVAAAPYTISLDTTGLSGRAEVLEDGTISYDPTGAFDALQFGSSARESFTYTVTDAVGTTSQATVEVSILGLGDAPTPVTETTVGTEDQPVRMDVLANDTDADAGDSLKVVALRGVKNGTAEIAPDGQTILFTPNANFDDGTTFEYLVQDDQGQSNWGSATVGFNGINDAPVVTDISGKTEAGRAISLLLGKPEPVGISDLEGLDPFTLARAYGDPDAYDDHTLTIDTSGLLGKIVEDAGGGITYDPGTAFRALAAGQTATDVFTYTVTDLGGLSSTGTVRITVDGANDAPTANDDTAATTEDTALVMRPLANDTDPDAGDSLTIVDLQPPANGTATIVENGQAIEFTPDANFNGTTFLRYQVEDSGGLRDWARIDVTVASQNDAPSTQDLSGTITESGTLKLAPVFSDLDAGETLTLSLDTSATAGLVTQNADQTFSYDPNGAFDALSQGATGTDTFGFRVTDAAGAVASATATITITGENAAPVAVDDTYSVAEETPITLTPLANDLDGDGDPLKITSVSSVQNGAAVLSSDGLSVDFTPDLNFNGTASFAYAIEDPNGLPSVAQVEVTVTGVNDAPVATGYDVIIDPTTPPDEFLLDLQFTDPDIPYGDTHTLSIDFAASSSLFDQDPGRFGSSEFYVDSITGEVIYSPVDAFDTAAGGEVLTETIVVSVEDAAGAKDTVNFNISTVGVNDAPQSFGVRGVFGLEDRPNILSLGEVIDPDFGDTHQISSIANPTNVTAQLLPDGTIEYTSDPNFWGKASLDVTVQDAAGASVTRTVDLGIDSTADPVSVGFTTYNGPAVNQFYLDVSAIRSLESSGENLNELTLEVVDANGALLPNQAAYLSQSAFTPNTWPSTNAAQRVLVTIPDDAPSDFGIRANLTAYTPGIRYFSNDPDKFTTATDTFDVSWNQASNSFQETFTFTDQSIWQTGTADTRHEVSFGTGATLAPSVDQSQTLIYANLTAAGVGAKTHISGAVGVDSLLSFGITNTMFAEGGGTSGRVTYDGAVDVFHNKVTDRVQFDTTALLDLANSSFTADSPNLGFSTALNNLVFNLSAYAKIWGYVHFKTGVSTSGPEFNIGGSTSVGINIPNFEVASYDGSTLSLLQGLITRQGTNYTRTFDSGDPLKNELATVTLTKPALSSASTQLDSASLTSGARSEFANLTWDIDGIASTIAKKKNPVDLGKGFGSEGDPAYAFLRLEALDLDLVNRLSYQQNHILTPSETLPGVLVLEDGDRFVFNFGDSIDVGTLASHDQNGDGRLSYQLELDPKAQFQTKAQMVYEMFDRLDILKASFGGGVNVGLLDRDFSKTLGPWKSTNSNLIDLEKYFPITTQDFALAFDDASTSTFLL